MHSTESTWLSAKASWLHCSDRTELARRRPLRYLKVSDFDREGPLRYSGSTLHSPTRPGDREPVSSFSRGATIPGGHHDNSSTIWAGTTSRTPLRSGPGHGRPIT